MRISFKNAEKIARHILPAQFFPESDYDYLFDFDRGNDIYRCLPKNLKIKNMKILDLGAGIGTVTAYFSKLHAKVVAVEKDKRFAVILKELRKENNLDFQIFGNDFLKLQAKRKFDLIICNDVLEHVKDKEPFVRKMNSVLKNGGLAFVKFPNIKSFVQYVSRDHLLLPFPLSKKIMKKLDVYNIKKKDFLFLLSKCGFEPFDVTKEYFVKRKINKKMFKNSFSKRFGINLWKIMRRNQILAQISLYHAPQIVILAKKVEINAADNN